MGIAILFERAGFEVLEVGQWGSNTYSTKLWVQRKWPDYAELQASDGSVKNDKRHPVSVWLLARKPMP